MAKRNTASFGKSLKSEKLDSAYTKLHTEIARLMKKNDDNFEQIFCALKLLLVKKKPPIKIGFKVK